jgi:ATP-binding cassette subfamily B protein
VRLRRRRVPPSARGYIAQAYLDHRRELLIGTAAAIAWRAVGWSMPLVVGAALDRGVADRNRSELGTWVAVIVVLAFTDGLLAMARHRHAAIPAARSAVAGRVGVLRTVHGADGHLRRQFPPGDTLARATVDVDRVRQFVDFTPTFIGSGISLAVVCVVVFVTDPVLGLVIALPIICSVTAIWMRSARSEQLSRVLQSHIAESIVLADASTANFKAIAGIGAAARIEERWRDDVATIHASALRVARLEARYQPFIELAAALSLIGALWVGGHRVIDGRASLATVIAALGWAVYMSSPLQQIAQATTLARRGRASASRLDRLTRAAPLIADPTDPELPIASETSPTGGAALGVELRGVTVELDGRRLLDQCSLTIAPGSVLAIVTATGGGKSTIAGLLDRSADVQGGAVLIGGVDVRRWRVADLHRAVRVLGRGEFVFGGTVRDNAAFGHPDASDDELAAAIHRAGAADIVVAKGGLDGHVGVAGRSLSGGQRQRLSLARAWLTEPAVLVLDEATAAVDPRREAEILTAATEAGCTVVLLTSRASVAARAGTVVLIEAGRVAATGAHDELAASYPGYRDLVEERVDLTS